MYTLLYYHMIILYLCVCLIHSNSCNVQTIKHKSYDIREQIRSPIWKRLNYSHVSLDFSKICHWELGLGFGRCDFLNNMTTERELTITDDNVTSVPTEHSNFTWFYMMFHDSSQMLGANMNLNFGRHDHPSGYITRFTTLKSWAIRRGWFPSISPMIPRAREVIRIHPDPSGYIYIYISGSFFINPKGSRFGRHVALSSVSLPANSFIAFTAPDNEDTDDSIGLSSSTLWKLLSWLHGICIYIYIYIHIQYPIYVYIIHTRVCVYIYIYVYIYIHLRIYMYGHWPFKSIYNQCILLKLIEVNLGDFPTWGVAG